MPHNPLQVRSSLLSNLQQLKDSRFSLHESPLLTAPARNSSRRQRNSLYTVIVRGSALEHALKDDLRESFAELAMNAESVICCRVTPAQKAALVALVKEAGKLTLAIGDGGNDVAMIQEAAVGVGIRGKEG